MADTPEAETGHPFTRVPIEVTVSVGKAHPKVKELLSLENEAVLMLDKKVEDPVELYVGDKLIALGELQELDGENAGQLAVRLTEIADLSNGL
ncbi:Flagellar motor switch protein FliN [Candidatus Rhodobacter oscarellae]|uniref:Flagellar motor switch protein FliN n=1 Tax=Candidatus Rhodobacter oscarellae TaxID=1675527 RepID=A0A0J9GZU7_9RHOB|nr:FliM/FliN family flagellar motor C-terminal domain-containing protein [Candidatus Rhodobacter lobularis]KMW59023.1 Flagellar motor switch protein FliN [Candidatus Rhodobacter lobularis]